MILFHIVCVVLQLNKVIFCQHFVYIYHLLTLVVVVVGKALTLPPCYYIASIF